MSTNKYQRFTVLLAIFLILVGLASLVGVSFFVLEHESPAAGTLLLLPILLIASACVLLYDYVHRRKLSRLATTFRFERSLYREALLYNCDYAYTVNLTRNKIHAVHRAGLLQPYHFRPDICYDDAIERVMQNLAPAMLFGDKDLYLAQHFLDAYQADKRVLSLEYHLKQENSYKQKSVFLTQNNITGDIFAFVALHDVTEKFRSEQKTKSSLMELTDAAKQLASGNLDVKIESDYEGDIAILAKGLQNTADQLRIYINSIHDLARKDSMTGMENRTAYVGAIAEIDVRLKKNEELHFAVVMFDLDDLKHVNDVHGHAEGDRYIIAASDLITTACPENSRQFRIGGDEFAAILFGKSLNELNELNTGFENALRKHNQKAGIRLSISHGYAMYNPQKDKSFADVYARADAEMYACKRRKKLKSH